MWLSVESLISLNIIWDHTLWTSWAEAEFLDEIQTKISIVFLLAILRHCLFEISISSNSRYLLQFLQFSYCKLLRRNKENLKETIPPSPWFKKSIQKSKVWELSRFMPRNLNEILRSWVRFLENFDFFTQWADPVFLEEKISRFINQHSVPDVGGGLIFHLF